MYGQPLAASHKENVGPACAQTSLSPNSSNGTTLDSKNGLVSTFNEELSEPVYAVPRKLKNDTKHMTNGRPVQQQKERVNMRLATPHCPNSTQDREHLIP